MQNTVKNYFRLLAEGHEDGAASKIFIPALEFGSWVYGGAVGTMRACYEKKIFRRRRLPFPVVSVGNLTWGGTGKTPLVEYLAYKVAQRYKTPLILSRGYSLDEVEQMRHHLPKAIVGAGKNRLKVAEELAKKQRIDLAILDDGLQHWPIERDIEIIVINALNPFGNEKLIPRGILREPLAVLKKAAILVLSHTNLAKPQEVEKLKARIRTLAPNAFLVESYLEPLFFYRADRRTRIPLEKLQNHRVATFSGVGTPRSFQLLLSRHQIKPIRNFEFEDHHVFTEAELQEIKQVSQTAGVDEIITTEKDFYRDPEKTRRILNPLVLAARLRIAEGEDVLTERLFRLLGVTK